MKKFVFTLAAALLVLTACDPDKKPEIVRLDVRIHPTFGSNADVVFNSQQLVMGLDTVKFTRADMIFSEFALITEQGARVDLRNEYAHISLPDKSTLSIPAVITPGQYAGFAFSIGLDSATNHGDPSIWSGTHPLNPNVNNLHWGWTGGYIFAAMEGYYQEGGAEQPWLYHIALMENKMDVVVMAPLDLTDHKTLTLNMDLEKFFKAVHDLSPVEDGDFSHSTFDNGLAHKLSENLAQSFSFESLVP
jgi:hypothetical protein